MFCPWAQHNSTNKHYKTRFFFVVLSLVGVPRTRTTTKQKATNNNNNNNNNNQNKSKQ